MIREIKIIILGIVRKYKHTPKRLNKELTLTKFFIQQSGLFQGKKKKLYKFINLYKIKEK